MFVTIWMWTHEWSLISIRATAFTFATCHQRLIWSSLLTRSMTVRSFLFARTGTRMRICFTASAGVRRVSRSASSEAGCSILFSVSGSSVTGRAYVVHGSGPFDRGIGHLDKRTRGLLAPLRGSLRRWGPARHRLLGPRGDPRYHRLGADAFDRHRLLHLLPRQDRADAGRCRAF